MSTPPIRTSRRPTRWRGWRPRSRRWPGPIQRSCRSRSWASGWWSCASHRLAGGTAPRWTRAFADAGGPEDAGAPTMQAWARRELRLTAAEAAPPVPGRPALDALPDTRAALNAGKSVSSTSTPSRPACTGSGSSVIAAFEPVLLDVARACDPAALRAAVDKIRDVLDPDAAEAAYVRALERRDVTARGGRRRLGAGRVPRPRDRLPSAAGPLGRVKPDSSTTPARPGSAARRRLARPVPGRRRPRACRPTAACGRTCSLRSPPTGSRPPP